jgi:hypothetical protein
MIHFFRHWLTLFGLVGLTSLGGCVTAAPPHSPVPVPAAAVEPVFTLDTPIDQITADPHGKAVLERDLPGLMASPHYLLFSGMSLSQLAPLSGGHLTPAKLLRVKADLAALSHGP